MEDFLEDKPKKQKRAFRLHRRLFLLVFALAVLLQSLSFVQVQLGNYYHRLENDFKVILVVDGNFNNDVLTQMGESLSAKEDITDVKLFAPDDALAALERKNPQLTDAMLLMGKNKMPAYYELRLNFKAVNNIQLFIRNLASEYKELSPKYNLPHAQMIFYTGLCYKLLNMAAVFSLLLFLAFMFLVEAYPAAHVKHLRSGVVSGVLAGLCALAFFAVLIYPTGFLVSAFEHFTSWERQTLLLVFCGLLGWTLTKWQKF